jgi:hypothetical protein
MNSASDTKFYRAHARFVAADMTDTGSQQVVYPPIIVGNSNSGVFKAPLH